jgi:hypothetical protein
MSIDVALPSVFDADLPVLSYDVAASPFAA